MCMCQATAQHASKLNARGDARGWKKKSIKSPTTVRLESVYIARSGINLAKQATNEPCNRVSYWHLSS